MGAQAARFGEISVACDGGRTDTWRWASLSRPNTHQAHTSASDARAQRDDGWRWPLVRIGTQIAMVTYTR